MSKYFRSDFWNENACCAVTVTCPFGHARGMGIAGSAACMNIGNASGFFVFGVAMWLLPNIAPDLFPRSGMDGSSARAMWIQVMAVVHATIGLSYLLLPLFAAL